MCARRSMLGFHEGWGGGGGKSCSCANKGETEKNEFLKKTDNDKPEKIGEIDSKQNKITPGETGFESIDCHDPKNSQIQSQGLPDEEKKLTSGVRKTFESLAAERRATPRQSPFELSVGRRSQPWPSLATPWVRGFATIGQKCCRSTPCKISRGNGIR